MELRLILIDGGAGEDRTLYLFNAIEALSQMSYSPTRLGRDIIHVFRACRSKCSMLEIGWAVDIGMLGLSKSVCN